MYTPQEEPWSTQVAYNFQFGSLPANFISITILKIHTTKATSIYTNVIFFLTIKPLCLSSLPACQYSNIVPSTTPKPHTIISAIVNIISQLRVSSLHTQMTNLPHLPPRQTVLPFPSILQHLQSALRYTPLNRSLLPQTKSRRPSTTIRLRTNHWLQTPKNLQHTTHKDKSAEY